MVALTRTNSIAHRTHLSTPRIKFSRIRRYTQLERPLKCNGIDLSLYLVTNGRYVNDTNELYFKIKQFYAAGGTTVQLRFEKNQIREYTALAKLLSKDVPKWSSEFKRDLAVVINNYPDVAFYAGLKNVHLGPTDSLPEDAKKLLGPHSIIGYTVNDHKDVIHANEDDNVSYIGMQIFRSKFTNPTSNTVWGLEGLAEISQGSKKPIVAIGNMTEENADAVLKCLKKGDGIAFVSCILTDKDIIAITTRLREKIDNIFNENQKIDESSITIKE